MTEKSKVYVPVEVRFDDQGVMRPVRLTWEDGQQYEIDRILQVKQAPALKAGGQGDRYTIRVNGRDTYLFFEHNPDMSSPVTGRWFVERRRESA